MICPHCQRQNRDTAKVCAQCGKPIFGSITGVTAMLANRYRVLKEIGRGGMGAVYLAEDTRLFGRTWVVKEMLAPTDPGEQREAEDNFRREAELLSHLRHPNIPEIHDYFVESGKYYLVMELAEGDDLEKRLAKNGAPLSERQVVGYAEQVCSVLAYLAKQNPPVIHRDIKPANIIVDSAGQIKLVDFGIARAKAIVGMAVSKDTSLWGTTGYAPPEQHAGKTEPRSDVYALGATMHHLLTGVDPRMSPQHQFKPVNSINPNVSLSVSQLVEQMLNPDVARRPSATALANKLQAIASVRPLVFSPTEEAYTIQDLVELCEVNRLKAIQLLKDHHVEDWLTELGRADLASEAKKTRIALNRRKSANQNQMLENFLDVLAPTRGAPSISVSPAQLNLTIQRGAATQVKVTVQSNGRSVSGAIQPVPSAYFTAPATFECRPPAFQSSLTLTFNPNGASNGKQRASVVFRSGNMKTTLEIDYTVFAPPPIQTKQKPNIVTPPPQASQRVDFTKLRFHPSIVELSNISELAVASQQNWQDAIYYLYTGEVYRWLLMWGRNDLAAAVARPWSGDSTTTMIDLLTRIDPTLGQPTYTISRTQIDLGTIRADKTATVNFVVGNNSKGILSGRFSVSQCITISPQTILCLPHQSQAVSAQINPSRTSPNPDGSYSGKIDFTCNTQPQSIFVTWNLARLQSNSSSQATSAQPNLTPTTRPSMQSTPSSWSMANVQPSTKNVNMPINRTSNNTVQVSRQFPKSLYRNLLLLAPFFGGLIVLLALAMNLESALVMFLGSIGFCAGFPLC